jgi:hypothetical protein
MPNWLGSNAMLSLHSSWPHFVAWYMEFSGTVISPPIDVVLVKSPPPFCLKYRGVRQEPAVLTRHALRQHSGTCSLTGGQRGYYTRVNKILRHRRGYGGDRDRGTTRLCGRQSRSEGLSSAHS